MIFKGSRYESVGVAQVNDASGKAISALRIRVIPTRPAGYLHTVTAGDRIDLLAYKYYSNPEKFWLIGDANSVISAEDLIVPGQKVLIPPDQTS
jgi:nucleoid-associated protein YgaU